MTSTHGYGRRVVIAHDDGFESLYAHMGKISVEEGQKVTRQTKLGEVGLTGFTTGPHIHFELHRDGAAVNPKYFLDLSALPTQQ
jgi:murein DD-endopeptidase MepM/ murein hydrolase activator NlpD